MEVDQTSASASKPGPSQPKNLYSTKTSAVEAMNVDYGPALPPRLDPNDSHIEDASDHQLSSVEDPSGVASTRPKKSSHVSKHYDMVPSSVSDHYSDCSDDPQPALSRPKKHSDKSKHKSRSRLLPSSSEVQSPEHKNRSLKPSRKSYPDQDHPQHDPDPPDPSGVASTRPKKSSHVSKHYDMVPSSASDHYSDYSDDPQPALSRPKKHSDKSNINQDPDSYLHLQRRLSPLNVGIGLLSLLGSLTLIRTILNMTLTLLTTGK